MYYIYVIRSITHSTRYIGSTDNPIKRLQEYNNGRCRYTRGRKPWKLIYQEGYITRGETMNREKFLKSGQGRKFLADSPPAKNPSSAAK